MCSLTTAIALLEASSLTDYVSLRHIAQEGGTIHEIPCTYCEPGKESVSLNIKKRVRGHLHMSQMLR